MTRNGDSSWTVPKGKRWKLIRIQRKGGGRESGEVKGHTNVQCDVCGRWGPFQYIGGNFLCADCRKAKGVSP